ncbi:putative secreted protein [Lysobacter dokdonensis DS-58]|uniref:Putative secreted protein n=1 Tax=Lysobacter dokdonensis DS-58 TaxID=1300345 RepID=A0A0A2WCD7_9GAMM|nr:DUF5916 domain-containing protein [Lysobacter dokdonensis]KGQ17726.1 putative secreted protein [Lysobacter dokdonensis DS-58]
MRSRLPAATLTAAILLALSGPSFAAIVVDGKIDPAEWQGAQHVTDFRITQPLTGAPGSQPTEAWILATPEGLAIGFRNTQPSSIPRNRQKIRRDEQAQVDRNNLMIDFDGDGRTGYNFMVTSTDGINDAVITNENRFSTDWDGNWQHAASEDENGWSSEMLIPWYIAPMAKGKDGKRTFRIYLDRVIGSSGERSAWPAASFERPRFLSDFTPVEVPIYNQALIAITPYVSGLYDNIGKDGSFDTGADIFWKPNGQFQLTATLNPDFGQVESDDIVVNFSANETFFSDKRPFFTENQGPFEFTTPSDFSQLVYTRRVGGPTDDGSGAGDITAAVKANGSFGATKYGVLIADEADEAGRTFTALRLSHDFAKQNVGMMVTQVDRPFFDRTATVVGFDQNWRPNEKWNIQNRLIFSDIDEGRADSPDWGRAGQGDGFTTIVDYEAGNGWRHQFLGMHFSGDLEINDFGFLSRPDLNYAHYELKKRITDMPKESSYSSHDWRWRVGGSNDDTGVDLQRQFRMSVSSQLKDGGNDYAQINVNTAGHDDRILRGNGIVKIPSNFNSFAEKNWPRHGAWAFYANVGFSNYGIGDSNNDRGIGWNTQFQPTYFINDDLSLYTTLYAERTPQWMIWYGDNLIGTFDEHAQQLDFGVNWNFRGNQELRVKMQALGLDADRRQAWRTTPDGTPVPSNDRIDDFALSNLGFQVRYRWEFKPLSYLYVVYGRGGDLFNEYQFGAPDANEALNDAFSLRDDEQLVVKLSYRFEL